MATLVVRQFRAPQDYQTIWRAMQAFTSSRTHESADELWLLQHKPVYTQGQAGKPEHVINPGNAPVVQTDRGGQITWHGPGQLMIYTLLDNRRLHLNVRKLVDVLEQMLIAVLNGFAVSSYAKQEAPGVYLQHHNGAEAKIAALGLRVKKNGCYHGAALNIDCDLAPFSGINPCGYEGQVVTRLADCLPQLPPPGEVEQYVIDQIVQALNYTQVYRVVEYD